MWSWLTFINGLIFRKKMIAFKEMTCYNVFYTRTNDSEIKTKRGGLHKMEEHTQYFIVDGNMLPEIYLKVAQAKELLERGEVRTIHQAVCQIGISRSAFYKYKDAIRPFQDMTQGRIISFQIRLKNEPGVLSLILNNFAKWGANILTINQSIPEGRTAIVHIGAETSRLGITLAELLTQLEQERGVIRCEVLAG